MQISPAGAVAYVLWYEIKNHSKQIELGEFVVMPNHVHGILILGGGPVVGTCMQRPHRMQGPYHRRPYTNGHHFPQTQYRCIHYPFLQICRHQILQPIGFRIRLANPIP